MTTSGFSSTQPASHFVAFPYLISFCYTDVEGIRSRLYALSLVCLVPKPPYISWILVVNRMDGPILLSTAVFQLQEPFYIPLMDIDCGNHILVSRGYILDIGCKLSHIIWNSIPMHISLPENLSMVACACIIMMHISSIDEGKRRLPRLDNALQRRGG